MGRHSVIIYEGNDGSVCILAYSSQIHVLFFNCLVRLTIPVLWTVRKELFAVVYPRVQKIYM